MVGHHPPPEVFVHAIPTSPRLIAISILAVVATVVAPVSSAAAPADRTLYVDPTHGEAGTEVSIHGCEYYGDTVTVVWDPHSETSQVLGTAPIDSDNCFSTTVTIPGGASPGEHTIEATSPDAQDARGFTVDDTSGGDQPPPPPAPTLVLDPTDVSPGGTTDASGCNYTASGAVTVHWTDGTVLATPTADSDGCFDTTLTVPSNAVAGSNAVTASNGAGEGRDSVVVHAVFLQLQPATGAAGDTTTAISCGWPARHDLVLTWDGDTPLGSNLRTDGQGCLQGPIGIPAATAPGTHDVTVRSKTLGITASATYTVQEPLTVAPYRVMLPPPTVQLQDVDITPDGVEITQGIQCFDTSEGLSDCPDNSLPLALGRVTAVRVYLTLSGRTPATHLDDVPVRLHYRVDDGAWHVVNASGPALRQRDRSSADGTTNILIAVTGHGQRTLDYWVEVDPEHTIDQPVSNDRFPETGYGHATFQDRKGLDILGERLDYNPSGAADVGKAGGRAVNGGAALWLEHLLPIPTGSLSYRNVSGYLDWTSTLPTDTNTHALIRRLNGMWVLAQVFAQAFTGTQFPLDHLYGWVPSSGNDWGHADMPVYPHAGGLGVVAVGTDAPGADIDHPGPGTLIFGHELVHDYDLKHTNTPDSCGSTDDTSTFPYSSSSIQEYGFDPVTQKVYDPTTTHDVMSYCPSGGSKQGWISPFTWSSMFAALAPGSGSRANLSTASTTRPGADSRAPQSVAPSDGTLVVQTTIQRTGGGSLTDTYLTDRQPALDQPPAGDLSVELRDTSGGTLAQRSFGVDFTNEYRDSHQPIGPGNTAPYDEADVQLTLPWDPSATKIVLLHGSQVLDTRDVSGNAPSITVTDPASPATWHAGDTAHVAWDASDPDGDALHYALLYTHDAGASWHVLARGLTADSYDVPVDDLAGGDAARFRVVASDGVRTATADSAAVSVPDHAPTATILGPADGTVVGQGDLVVLAGGAVDAEDGRIPAGSLTWTSDRDGTLGTGDRVTTNDLSAGTHTITLTATDRQGHEATDTVTVTVTDATDPVVSPAPPVVGEPTTATSHAIAGTQHIVGCTVDYGDGAATVAGVLEGHTCHGPAHTYRDAGTRRVVVTFLGADGALLRRGTTVEVAEASLPLVTRLAGTDRFATAAAISRTRFDAGVPVAFVATGGSFADALAGVPAAGLAGGPILLVAPDRIPAPTATELGRLRPQRIVVLGGEAAVSGDVAHALDAYTDGAVTRISGPDRFATAAAIATATFDAPVDVAYVATGEGFADALAGGPLATRTHGPVLLTARDWLPGPTRDALLNLTPSRIVVLGGTGAVSDAVVERLSDLTDGAVTRIAGPNRLVTATRASKAGFGDGSAPVVYVATGGGFADALAGGPLAAVLPGPLLLVGDSVSDVVRGELARLAPRRVVVLGGRAAVPEQVVDTLRQLMRTR